MEAFKVEIGKCFTRINDKEKEADAFVKRSIESLMKYVNVAKEKKNQTVIEEMLKINDTACEELSLSRKELMELNASREKSEQFKIPSIDVGEIIKQQRRRTKSRNTEFKTEPVIDNAKKESLNPNATFLIDRDFITPDNDSPMMEIKRKLIEDELNRSVTMRRKINSPRLMVNDKTCTKTSFTTQSPTNNMPRKLSKIKKDESKSPLKLQSVAPIPFNFDQLNTDDEFSDEENYDTGKYPPWTKFVQQTAKIQFFVNPDLISMFFNQQINIQPKDLFPNSGKKLIRRGKSSMMWMENFK